MTEGGGLPFRHCRSYFSRHSRDNYRHSRDSYRHSRDGYRHSRDAAIVIPANAGTQGRGRSVRLLHPSPVGSGSGAGMTEGGGLPFRHSRDLFLSSFPRQLSSFPCNSAPPLGGRNRHSRERGNPGAGAQRAAVAPLTRGFRLGGRNDGRWGPPFPSLPRPIPRHSRDSYRHSRERGNPGAGAQRAAVAPLTRGFRLGGRNDGRWGPPFPSLPLLFLPSFPRQLSSFPRQLSSFPRTREPRGGGALHRDGGSGTAPLK